MILGIGTDLTPIARIKDTLEKQGERFITRCFAPSEQEYVMSRATDNMDLQAAGFAKRWAAKEATAKALGFGIRDGIFLKDIIVTNDEQGKPSLDLTGGAKQTLEEKTPAGYRAKIDISLSDDGGMALAFVVISAEKE